MPRAELPHTPAGWIVAFITGTVGLIAGFIFLRALEQLGLT